MLNLQFVESLNKPKSKIHLKIEIYQNLKILLDTYYFINSVKPKISRITRNSLNPKIALTLEIHWNLKIHFN